MTEPEAYNAAMLIRTLASCLALTFGLIGPATAVEFHVSPRAVLELFTSQGCSESPKADAILNSLSKRKDVVALAYHVDYWDYIGWPDSFGRAEYSERQRAYAESWGSTRIFTPQMVVNGAEGIVGSHQGEVEGAITTSTLPLNVGLTSSNNMLDVAIAGDQSLPGAVVWLVTFLDHADVAIDGGMNKGKKVAYSQIVTGRQALGMWDPVKGISLKLPMGEILTDKANGAVILVQEESHGLPGRILGAASFTL